jgi:aspartate kinase
MKTQTPVVVKKFGGTSVGTLKRIESVAERVLNDQKMGQAPIVVVSAMSGETNRLVALANEILPNHRGPAYDMLLATGEQASVALTVMAFEKQGAKARPYLAHQLGILTDSMFSRAKIQSIRTEQISKDIACGIIPVVAGFQGIDKDGHLTTLGRGGSDTTAVAVAAALKLSECEIYTDVPAVFSADPRLVPKAREMSRLSFEEMLEMASLGSKVLHSRAVEIGAKHGVKIHLRTTFEAREGTWIVPEGEALENPIVSAVTHEASTCIVSISPVSSDTLALAELFEELAKEGIIIDVISQTESDRLAFSVSDEDREFAKNIAEREFPKAKISVMENVSKITIIGVGMRTHPGVAATFFRTLARSDIQVHLVTTSEIKVSAIIDKEKLQTAAQALHKAFGLDKK